MPKDFNEFSLRYVIVFNGLITLGRTQIFGELFAMLVDSQLEMQWLYLYIYTFCWLFSDPREILYFIISIASGLNIILEKHLVKWITQLLFYKWLNFGQKSKLQLKVCFNLFFFQLNYIFHSHLWSPQFILLTSKCAIMLNISQMVITLSRNGSCFYQEFST